MILILLFFNIFLFSEARPFSEEYDKFAFDFQITCRFNNKATFYYDVQFLENDTVGSGEWITEKHSETVYRGTLHRTFLGKMNGDEILSDGYSVTAIFNHDCTRDGRRVEMQFEFMQLCKIGYFCRMTYHADLTGRSGYQKVHEKVVG